ncbi:MAG TPA: START-like domain-containing protein [Saprospiraceae bacterium]|nr:START-like domain-containing protein [Saprospiraceae bacterium]HMP24335.1 START-like domain-containing protein [Saprospiraceae bacterium]
MERVKITLEFLFRASPTILYQFLTTPSCLIRWFCDKVDIQGDTYVFGWDKYTQLAELVDDIEEERLRFRWEDAEDPAEYLEFRISRSPVTDETILEIIDFCDADEVDDQKQLWKTQIEQLRKETGS